MNRDDYGRVVEPYRAELHAHCYRMLGSVPDAEDALQETLLSAWRGLTGFEGRSSLRTWLYKIATNVCLKAIERRPRRVLPIDYGPPADPHDGPAEPLLEPVWVEPYPDDGLRDAVAGPDARYEQRESVELAFIAALQHLSARQRAVLILRDVLGFSGSEVAELLETSADSVYSALQRAHRAIDTRLPQQSQQAALRALGDERLQRIVSGYVDAWEHKDIDRVVAMLAEDVVMTMPPRPSWYRGVDDVSQFMREWPLASTRPWRILPARASGQIAFGHYGWEEDEQLFLPHALNVLRLRGERIVEIAAYLTPEVFGPLGLPTSLPRP